MNMSLSGYRLDPHHLTPIPSDNENENEGSSSRAVSKVDSSGKGKGLTKELPAKDDDSDDLLKYIPYLDKLEKTEKIAAEVLEKERHDGTYLIKLLDTGDFDEGLVKEFKTMINMTKHMNSMLFKGDKDSKFKVRPRTLKQVEEIAVQVIHYFDKLSDQFDVGIDKIVEIKKYLPSLGTQVSLHHIRTALRTWNAKIMGELACPRDCEKELFDGFAILYDAQIYHPFLQVRKVNPRHEMCRSLEEHFNTIDHYVEHTCATYAVLIREHQKFKSAMAGARNRLLSDIPTVINLSKEVLNFKHIKAKMEREGAAADAALASRSYAPSSSFSSAAAAPTPGPSRRAAAATTKGPANVAVADKYFKTTPDVAEDVPSDPEDDHEPDEDPADEQGKGKGKEKENQPTNKSASKGKRNSKGKSSHGKGKGKRRSR